MPQPLLAPDDLVRAGLPGDGIALVNPLVAEESVLRPSLRPGLLKAIAYNASHRATGVSLFEIGHVYLPPRPGEVLPDEREVIGVALAGRRGAGRGGVVGRAGRGARRSTMSRSSAVAVDGLHATRTAPAGGRRRERSALVGEIDPDVLDAHGIGERVAWLEVELLPLHELARPDRRYQRVSRYPSSDIDLAFVLDDAVPAAALSSTLRCRRRRPAGRPPPVRRVPRPGGGRRPSQPGLPVAAPGARPHAHRRRRGSRAPAVHRGGDRRRRNIAAPQTSACSRECAAQSVGAVR